MKFFNIKFMLPLLMIAAQSFTPAHSAEVVSFLFFSEACNGTGVADDGTQWTVTSDAEESTWDQTRGVHYGTGSKPVKYIKLTTSDVTGTITKIVVNASGSNTPSLTVKVGNVAFGSTHTGLTTKNAAYTFTGSASGNIEVLLSKSKAATGALYVRSVSVTYETEETVDYVINATSNDEAFGTVSVDGNTIVATPSEGYRVSTAHPYDVLVGEANVSQEGNSFKVQATADCTIRINFEAIPTYMVRWSVNGVITSTASYQEGESINFPTNPADIDGKVFVGWATVAILEATDTKPTLVTQATMGTQDVTYYAVFATLTTGTQTSLTDVLTAELTEVTANKGYYDWTDKATGVSPAIYAGNSARTNQDAIQLRATTPSGIVTTSSGGKVSKVTVTWDNGTQAGRTLEVYGKNRAYDSAADLYSSSATTKGTKLGNIVKGTSTELIIEGDYEYVGLRSEKGAMYLTSISITWGDDQADSYSGFCTTIDGGVCTEVAVSVGPEGMATFSSTYTLDFSGVSKIAAYTAAERNGKIVFSRIYQVPAHTGLLLRNALGQDAGAVEQVMVPVTVEAETVEDNVLVAVDETIEALPSVEGNWHNYILNKHSEYGLGFFQANNKRVQAGKAYLRTNVATSRIVIDYGDTTTGIVSLDAHKTPSNTIYNLNGQQVETPRQGCLYIIKGKKVVAK